MPRYQLKIISHTQNQQDFKLNGEKRQLIDDIKKTEILALPDKDFKAIIIIVLREQF